MADVTLFALAVVILLFVISNLRKGSFITPVLKRMRDVVAMPLHISPHTNAPNADDITMGHEMTLAPMAPYMLEVVSCRVPKGITPGTFYSLTDGTNSLGSAPTNEPGVHRIALEGDRAISRDHFYIENKEGQFVAIDRESRYGTQINNHRLQGSQEVPLKVNDMISVGNTTLRFKEAETGGGVLGGRGRVQPQAKFTIQNGTQKGQHWTLGQNRVRIGRAQDAEWQLSDAKSSRHHAEIRREGDLIHITDLGSSHGVFVNNHKYQTRVLDSRDVIKIGDTEIKYELG